MDLVLTEAGEKTFVQCKQWKSFKVGVSTVRELYGVMAAHGAAGGFVVTSGRFTQEAAAYVTGVRTNRLHIVVDSYCRTDEPGVYAIGDVAGPPWLAHKASHEGVLCVEKIAGLDVTPIEPNSVPSCTFGHPQVASVGPTEADARRTGIEVKVGRFPFAANGMAIATGVDSGL
ncbi:MAG: DUF2034 domain-containing protein [Proteobacteria bacterium]|nr:DUF2034 domain-containing protein [Pseudomonadota bacterium]